MRSGRRGVTCLAHGGHLSEVPIWVVPAVYANVIQYGARGIYLVGIYLGFWSSSGSGVSVARLVGGWAPFWGLGFRLIPSFDLVGLVGRGIERARAGGLLRPGAFSWSGGLMEGGSRGKIAPFR